MKRNLTRKSIQFSFKSYFVLLLLVINSVSLFGQGTVKGVITDRADNAPLVAATIFVEGTTIGTISNFNGEYTLPLKAGSYTIKFLYLGYETGEETITVEDNQTVELNKELAAVAIMGEEVVITIQARGQLSAVNQQLRSNQIINVVSEERIRELPDENAAQAISRLPGVHLDESKVVIRGLESKMNQIAINGMNLPAVSMPSLSDGTVAVDGSIQGTQNLNSRSTDLGIISANMLSGIEVYKTLTPDMDADAIGGVVNLKFREAQPGLSYSITAQGSYNQQEKILGGTKFWGDVSNRFFDNRLGAILNVNYETKSGGEDWIRAGYNQHNSAPPGEGVYMLNAVNVYDQLKTTETIGGSLVLDYDLRNGQLLFTSLLSHSVPEETLYRDDMEPGRNYRYAFLSHGKYNTLLTNNSLSFEQQLGLVKLDASISHSYVERTSDFNYQMRVKDRTVLPFFDSLITEPIKLQMEPIDVYSALDTSAGQTARYYETTVIPNDYDESQWMADLDLEVPLRLSDNINMNFKVGGKYLRKNRNYDEQLILDYYPNIIHDVNTDIHDWLLSQGIENDGSGFFFYDIRDYDYQPNEGFMNDQGYYLDWVVDKEFMDEMILNQADLDLFTSDSRDGRSDYWGWESKTAAYAMAEINLGQRITLIPGVRFEQVHNEYSSYKIWQGTQWTWGIEDTLTKPADHINLLPHIHLRLKATDWWDIRFSYNNTLSRPDYHHAVPSVYYHEINLSTRAGNPYIKPAVSENFDANFTFYSRKMGLFTIGGYLKRIDGIFYMQPTLLKNIPDTTIISEFPTETYPALLTNSTDFYVNSPYTAYVRGLEVEWQSNFSWLRAPFNGIVLNTNYTHVWSETKYMQDRIRYEQVPGSFIPQPVEVDTFYVNRLLHQANDIANVSVGYDLKGFSARVSFRFQGNVISRIGTRPEENQYTNNIYAYDFVIKQSIPLKFGEFEVFLNAINFTNVPKSRYSTFKDIQGNDRNATTYERFSGRQFQLGLRFRY
jgi:TonB-dependent receptor